MGALFYTNPEDILSIEIKNPIILGEAVDDKTVILDLKLLLNNNRIIDVEMQVASQHFYPERALTYLCRIFDHLKAGQSYADILPCIQVSILDNDLFSQDDPRYNGTFLSEYSLKEKQTNKEYSDKFRLIMVSLKHIEHATDKDDPNSLYQWGKLFASTTWEGIKMIVANNEYMKSAAFTLKKLTDDEKIKLACEAKERAEIDLLSNYHAGESKGLAKGLAKGQAERDKLAAENNELSTEISRLKALLANK